MKGLLQKTLGIRSLLMSGTSFPSNFEQFLFTKVTVFLLSSPVYSLRDLIDVFHQQLLKKCLYCGKQFTEKRPNSQKIFVELDYHDCLKVARPTTIHGLPRLWSFWHTRQRGRTLWKISSQVKLLWSWNGPKWIHKNSVHW